MESEGVPAHRLDVRFRALLHEFKLVDLEREHWPAYGMWLDSTLAYVNPAYARQLPTSWGLGAKVLDATGILRASVERVHATVCETKEPAVMRYACPTASWEREFELRVFPVGLAAGEVRGLLAIHSLVLDRPHTRGHAPDDATYRDRAGLVHQCAHCRRTRRNGEREIWDVAPDYIDHAPANTSHGICAPCVSHYYGSLASE
jgi:hypothetical protein